MNKKTDEIKYIFSVYSGEEVEVEIKNAWYFFWRKPKTKKKIVWERKPFMLTEAEGNYLLRRGTNSIVWRLVLKFASANEFVMNAQIEEISTKTNYIKTVSTELDNG